MPPIELWRVLAFAIAEIAVLCWLDYRRAPKASRGPKPRTTRQIESDRRGREWWERQQAARRQRKGRAA